MATNLKAKFIAFMKEQQLMQEFEEDIKPCTMKDLNQQFKDGGAEFVLENGCIFFWEDSEVGNARWYEADKAWKEILNAE